MKTLGIIGGVGPQTTAKVYLSVIDHIRHSGSEAYPGIVIYNLPFPFSVENEAIVQGINSEKMIPYLIDGAKKLEISGATFGILPCNTLHKYIENIRESVKIPFLSIVEESVKTLQNSQVKTVGILASQTTIDSDIYGSKLNANNIATIYPDKSEQQDINNIIIEIINGKNSESLLIKIANIIESLNKKGADCILLACTDLQIVTSGNKFSLPVYDTTEILIKSSVNELKLS